MKLFKRKRGMMMKFKPSDLPPLIPSISPSIQGRAAFGLLDTEQKSVLAYALNDMALKEGIRISLQNCFAGTGVLKWAFGKKTILNQKPACKIWPPAKAVDLSIWDKIKQRLA